MIRKLLQRVFVKCCCEQECPKHEVAFAIEQAVSALDLPMENISTLLCYLELHPKKWIKVLPPAYTLCKICCYKGNGYLKRLSWKVCLLHLLHSYKKMHLLHYFIYNMSPKQIKKSMEFFVTVLMLLNNINKIISYFY